VRAEKRAARQAEIEQAAYDVLREQGYGAASMLRIAKQAKASNETLYSWYGDKAGLFRALIRRNAAEITARLEASLAEDLAPLESLRVLGPRLLALLTGPRAIALNQAAAADASGELGALIAEVGRDSVGPLIRQTLERARSAGDLAFTDSPAALDLYLDLLVGDLQIRRAIGRLPPLDEATVDKRAARALADFCYLLSPDRR